MNNAEALNLRHPMESFSDQCPIKSLQAEPKHEQQCTGHRVNFIQTSRLSADVISKLKTYIYVKQD